MRYFSGLAFTLFFAQKAFSQISNATLDEVSNSLAGAAIVPGVVPAFRPSALVSIRFTLGGEPLDVITGETLPPEVTENEPSYTLTVNQTTQSRGPFVVMMLDANGPPAENSTAITNTVHFLGGDFSANNRDSDLVSRIEPLARWKAPYTPAEDDPHRYVLFVFNQTGSRWGERAGSVFNSSSERENFNLTHFTSTLNLGSPIAGNYFLIEPSEKSDDSSSAEPSKTTAGPARGESWTRTDIPATITPLLFDDDSSSQKNVVGLASVIALLAASSALWT